MGKLNTNHRLILFPILLMTISKVINLGGDKSWMPEFMWFILPMSGYYMSSLLAIFVYMLVIAIIVLSANKKIKRIEIAIVPVLIFLTFFDFPWLLFGISPIYLIPSLICYGSIFLWVLFLT